MKVTVTRYLNVRVGRPSVNAPCFQFVSPGTELEVDGELYKGDAYDGIDTWFKDEAKNYYWSGGVRHSVRVAALLEVSAPASESKIEFGWFDKLGIKRTWDARGEKGALSTIAVLDTGYNKHNSDLATAVNKETVIINSLKYPGLELIIDDQSNEGHGNRCSSLIGSRNHSQWCVGIAPECKLMVGKVSLNREIRDFDYILNGIKWAIAEGADIISVSYAVELPEDKVQLYNEKFDALLSGNQVLVFASAGNSDGTETFGERYPASFPKCISVGATDDNGALSLLTVLSNRTQLHAPGINIESFGLADSPDPQSGTSFSTPIVAAIAGLAVSFLKANNRAINREDILAKLINTSDTIQASTSKKRVNIEKLFNELLK